MISNKPIIQHIKDFLDYCDVEKGLRNNTQKNYENYLKKFVEWLKYKNLESILPHQLSIKHIFEYKSYLSVNQGKTNKSLQKTTQNYYLIALRAFLAYFVAKDIVSLPPGKVTLPKPDKSVKTVKFLNLEQIKELFNALDKKTEICMRDRLIFELLIFGGFKMRQLVSLNVEDYINNKINVSKDILILIEKYIKKRSDKERALFINYRSRKNSSHRLTPRYIEAFDFYNNSKNLWDNKFTKSDKINKHHGKDWHRNMINEI